MAKQKQCAVFLKPHILDNVFTSGTYDEPRYLIIRKDQEHLKSMIMWQVSMKLVLPVDVEPEWQDLLAEINDHELNDHFLAGVYVHAVFEQIHPFVDGNGRVGEHWWIIMIHDIAPTMIYHEDKHEHYKSLEAIDVNEDLDPLISFIEKEQEKTWSRTQKKGQRS